jgi:hypothetical protein
LLIIEPTGKMTKVNAKRLINKGDLSRYEINALRMWASAREGLEVDPGIYDRVRASLAPGTSKPS